MCVDTFRSADIHAFNGNLGLGDKDGLTTGRVEISVADIGEGVGAEAGAVNEDSGGGEGREKSGERGVGPAD